jgi:membrane protein
MSDENARSDAAARQRLEPSWWNLIQQTFVAWSRDNVSRLGASLAYYAVFSVAPLFVFAVMVVGMIYGAAAAEGRIAQELDGVMGKEAAGGVQAMVAAMHRDTAGPLATVLSIGALMFGASGAFNDLRYGLNIVWKVRPSATAPWWFTLQKRLLAFGLVLLVGVLFLAMLVFTSFVQAAWQWVEGYVPFSGRVAVWLNYGVVVVVETVLFALIFKYLPDGKIAWGDVWLGALVTSLLFGVGNALIGLYFAHSTIGSAYGAAGSLAIFLLWAYYSAQILYLGAEFTQTYARMYGSQIEPEKHAEAFSGGQARPGQAR